MNAKFKQRVQEPYNEAWEILKTIRDDDSDEAWRRFRKQLDGFDQRIKTTPRRGNKDYIKGEKQYLEHLYSVLLEVGEMAYWILAHNEGEKVNNEDQDKKKTTR